MTSHVSTFNCIEKAKMPQAAGDACPSQLVTTKIRQGEYQSRLQALDLHAVSSHQLLVPHQL
jgi:hypothetical protein